MRSLIKKFALNSIFAFAFNPKCVFSVHKGNTAVDRGGAGGVDVGVCNMREVDNMA
jgi:hypothetical protein